MALAWTVPLIARLVGNVIKNRKDKNAKRREEDAIKKERVPISGVSGLVGYVVRMEALKGIRKNLSGVVALVIGGASLLGLSDFSSLLPELDVGRALELFTLGGGLLGIRDR